MRTVVIALALLTFVALATSHSRSVDTATAQEVTVANVAVAPQPGGLTQVISGTTDIQALIDAQTFIVASVWKLDVQTQRWLNFVVDAPVFVNTLVSLGTTDIVTLRAGPTLSPTAATPIIVGPDLFRAYVEKGLRVLSHNSTWYAFVVNKIHVVELTSEPGTEAGHIHIVDGGQGPNALHVPSQTWDRIVSASTTGAPAEDRNAGYAHLLMHEATHVHWDLIDRTFPGGSTEEERVTSDFTIAAMCEVLEDPALEAYRAFGNVCDYPALHSPTVADPLAVATAFCDGYVLSFVGTDLPSALSEDEYLGSATVRFQFPEGVDVLAIHISVSPQGSNVTGTAVLAVFPDANVNLGPNSFYPPQPLDFVRFGAIADGTEHTRTILLAIPSLSRYIDGPVKEYWASVNPPPIRLDTPTMYGDFEWQGVRIKVSPQGYCYLEGTQPVPNP